MLQRAHVTVGTHFAVNDTRTTIRSQCLTMQPAAAAANAAMPAFAAPLALPQPRLARATIGASTRASAAAPPPDKRPRASNTSSSSQNLLSGSTTRRALMTGAAAALAAAAALPPPARSIELYKTGTTRYIPQGRPAPSGTPPVMTGSVFPVGKDGLGLEAHDVTVGNGPADEVVVEGTLVAARWIIKLASGEIIENSGNAPILFRAGKAQVYPGIDAAVMGMHTVGAKRMVRGTGETFFSDITSGERSLVPVEAVVYGEVEVIRVNPYGPPRL
jgi:FKBP-type peptidyl-prolyl cis-trans isomerase